MNYYGPRELKNDDGSPSGKWHYTVRNDDRIWPVGYCAEGCPGHATPEEAREHYRQYELDNARYDWTMQPPGKCKVCGRFTTGAAAWGPGLMAMVYLCNAHRDREHLDPFVKSGDSISSY